MRTRLATLFLFSLTGVLAACSGSSQGAHPQGPRSSRMTETRRQFSSGAVGCAPEDIVVSDESNYSWKVSCHGQAFYCGGIAVAACRAEIAPPAAGAAATPSGAPHERNITRVRRESGSGFLGCPATEVTVTDESNYSWQASCRGHTVYCGTAGQSATICHEGIAPAPGAPPFGTRPGAESNMQQVRREASSGMIGCTANEIVISDASNYSWKASCRGWSFYCGAAGAGLSGCHVEVPLPPNTSGVAGSTGGGMSRVRREASTGYLGCPASEVVIADESNYSWVAGCRGHTVYCGAAGDATIACHEPISGMGTGSTGGSSDESNMAQVRREASSGFLGCPATEVVIGSPSNYSFTASCRGHMVYCGGGQGLTCSPPYRAAAVAPAAAAPR